MKGWAFWKGGNREEEKESYSSLPSSSSKKWHQHTRGMNTGSWREGGDPKEGEKKGKAPRLFTNDCAPVTATGYWV